MSVEHVNSLLTVHGLDEGELLLLQEGGKDSLPDEEGKGVESVRRLLVGEGRKKD